ncbi:MAG TPA: helix-turn-helix transcriptional regulator [Solirubrobacterales bacterium]|jgi:transcriptional regulator with XRE-family HTH domain
MAPRKEPQPALGQAIRRLRTERDLSQEELGHLAEIHPTWISHIESGRTNPAWGTVRRIAAVFEVPLSEVVLMAEAICADEDKEKI